MLASRGAPAAPGGCARSWSPGRGDGRRRLDHEQDRHSGFGHAAPGLPPNWAEIATAIAAFVGLLGIYVAWKTSERARHVALMAHLSERWDDELLVDSRRLSESYSPERLRKRMSFLIDQLHPELYVLLRMPDFLEDLAILDENGAISFEMIRKSLGGTLVKTWDHWQPTVSEMRGDQTYDLVYENFEKLAERMRRALIRLGEEPTSPLAAEDEAGPA